MKRKNCRFKGMPKKTVPMSSSALTPDLSVIIAYSSKFKGELQLPKKQYRNCGPTYPIYSFHVTRKAFPHMNCWTAVPDFYKECWSYKEKDKSFIQESFILLAASNFSFLLLQPSKRLSTFPFLPDPAPKTTAAAATARRRW